MQVILVAMLAWNYCNRVAVVDNLANSKIESLKRVQDITGKPLAFYQVDIRDRNALAEVFAKELSRQSCTLLD